MCMYVTWYVRNLVCMYVVMYITYVLYIFTCYTSRSYDSTVKLQKTLPAYHASMERKEGGTGKQGKSDFVILWLFFASLHKLGKLVRSSRKRRFHDSLSPSLKYFFSYVYTYFVLYVQYITTSHRLFRTLFFFFLIYPFLFPAAAFRSFHHLIWGQKIEVAQTRQGPR